MLEILEFVLGGFWRFIGAVIILSVVVNGLFNGTALIIDALRK